MLQQVSLNMRLEILQNNKITVSVGAVYSEPYQPTDKIKGKKNET